VRARSAKGSAAVCAAPPAAEGEVAFSFSYDRVTWSVEQINFKFVNRDEIGDWIQYFTGLVAVLALIGAGIFCYCKWGPKDGGDGAGLAPLIGGEVESDDLEKEPFLPKNRAHRV
jgi:hypothetical protein